MFLTLIPTLADPSWFSLCPLQRCNSSHRWMGRSTEHYQEPYWITVRMPVRSRSCAKCKWGQIRGHSR